MSLRDWLNEGHFKAHKTSQKEISQLLALFERDITDAQVKALSPDRRFATAYNAALVIVTAALAAAGYQASSEGHHYWTIQSLVFTLQPDARKINKFNLFRQKRNISDYERIGMVSEQEVGDMINLAESLHVMLVQWLKKNHPGLAGEL